MVLVSEIALTHVELVATSGPNIQDDAQQGTVLVAAL